MRRLVRIAQVEDVTQSARAAGEIERFELDSPSTVAENGADGLGGASYAIRFEGRVLASPHASAVEVCEGGDPVWTLPVQSESPGEFLLGAPRRGPGAFAKAVSSLKLPAEFELSLRAVLPGDARPELAVVRGGRERVATSFEPALQPLLVTNPPRVGSTIFLHLLGMHPRVVAYPPFQQEVRVASYWTEVLQALSEPASYLSQIAPFPKDFREGWWLGAPGPTAINNRELQDWLGSEAVESLAGFCQSRIDALYRRLGAQVGKADGRYFVEKSLPRGPGHLVRELYPEGREIFLVRDLRDVACSIFARRQRAGAEDSDEWRRRYVVEDLRRVGEAMVSDWDARSRDAHLVRYEDVVQRSEETLAGVLEYLGLEPDRGTIAEMLERAERPLGAMERHRTVLDAEDSVARWRHDLDPDLRSLALESLEPALARFGYPLDQ